MIDPMQYQILGHLLGALDDDEEQDVDSRLQRDPQWSQALADWRQRLATLESLRLQADTDPPPGLAERACRYVASCAPTPAKPPRSWKMSARPMPPHRILGFRGLDVAAVVALLVTLAIMVPPAINSSRYGARVAMCQEDLRQLGRAMTDHSRRQETAVSELAEHGQLTRTGLFAVGLLEDAYLTATHREVCPDAWLSVQGLLRASLRGAGLKGDASRTPAAGAQVAISPVWPGVACNGAADGWRPPVPASVPPLLADAPYAGRPGEGFPSHSGRGRNVLFADGHAAFLPVAATSGAADWFGAATDDAGEIEPLMLCGGR
jgi:prepilin-type processing-associated H-X9-DG protein